MDADLEYLPVRTRLAIEDPFWRAGDLSRSLHSLPARRPERIRLPVRRCSSKLKRMVQCEINWPEALRAADGENSTAVSALREIVLNGLRVALRDRTDVSEAQFEDFAQEALLRILQRLDQFAGRSKFTTWAHTIAINTAFTELRRKRWQDVSLDALTTDGRHLHECVAMPHNTLGDDEERMRLIEILRTAVAEKLSDKQRKLILCMLQGMPFDQVAEILGTNRNSAYKLFHDARCALKQHLAAAGVSSETVRTAFGT